jgi:hypothetical protein
VADQVVPVVQLAGQPGVAVGARLVHRQLHLLDQLPVLVHLDDPGRAALGDHRVPVGQPLERVDLDLLAVGPVLLGRVVLPHDLVRLPVGAGLDLDDRVQPSPVRTLPLGSRYRSWVPADFRCQSTLWVAASTRATTFFE